MMLKCYIFEYQIKFYFISEIYKRNCDDIFLFVEFYLINVILSYKFTKKTLVAIN